MNNDELYKKPFSQFPTRVGHDSRWRELARAIAADAARITDDLEKITIPENPGELVVLGSGIETVGFTSADEIQIREADYVFYCVADPATVVWLKAMRPDAYDLYVLYNDTKMRYLTYMQMAEAMLYYVRRGKRVACIFYGHPGIFVLSTHRAIQIARREGHIANMRPGISALDTLCADLGVDPSQPGMQTFEATDMLVRGRRPDPGLHVVLWQVGLIGELGYRRDGCLNTRFTILLDYLEEIYGPDQVVINYIGSRYPGIEPLGERHTIESLRDPKAQAKVTGISTFYLPPSEPAAADNEMLLKLGLIRPGQSIKNSSTALRVIDQYGPRERKAFEDFARFEVPMYYHWQADTAAARFILSLREDGELRANYRSNPHEVVATWSSQLTTMDRRRLSMRDAGAMQLAAKGVRTKVQPSSARMLRELLTKEKTSRSLLRSVRRANNPRTEVKQWSKKHGYDADWNYVAEDLRITLRQSLYPWTGCYLAKDSELSIVLYGLPGSSAADRLYVDGVRIQAARFQSGALYWRTEDGNATSGYIKADITPRGARRLVGSIWPAHQELASHHHIVALEHLLNSKLPLASLSGNYRIKSDSGIPLTVTVSPRFDSLLPRMQITLNGTPAKGKVTVGAAGFSVDGISVPLSAFVAGQGVPSFACGEYKVRFIRGDQKMLKSVRLETGKMLIEGHEVSLVNRNGNGRTISWEDGPPGFASGQLTTVIDPITLAPMLFGSSESETGTRKFLIRGMAPLADQMLEGRAGSPELGMPDWAWRPLVKITINASQKGGLFLWHGWERSVNNLRRLRKVLQLRNEA